MLIFAIFFTINLTTPMKAQQNSNFQSFQELKYDWPTSQLEIEPGKVMHYVEWGSENEEAVLFLHGLSSYLPAWKYNLPDFIGDYRVIAMDLPGFGKSFFPETPSSMKDFAYFIRLFCEKKGLSKVNLVGHSMGGQIAIVTALEFPDFINKLILVAPAGLETFSDDDREALLTATASSLLAGTSEAQLSFNYRYNFYEWPDRAQFMINDRLAIRSAAEFLDYCQQVHWAVKAMLDGPVLDKLPSLECPVLVVFGRQDRLIPNKFLHPHLETESLAREAVETIKNAQLCLIDKAGHFVMFEQFQQFNQKVREFLDQ
jgi:pimeloyl-ACP methyl ester carboxylesterase